MNVHSVVGNLSAKLGAVILENGRRNCRFFTLVYGPGSYRYCGVHNVGMATDACERLADAIKPGNGQAKLLAQGCISTG